MDLNLKLEPNQEVLKHYYHSVCDIHFYHLGWYKGYMYGILLTGINAILSFKEVMGKWLPYDCMEDLIVPRTIGEVFGKDSDIFNVIFKLDDKQIPENIFYYIDTGSLEGDYNGIG